MGIDTDDFDNVDDLISMRSLRITATIFVVCPTLCMCIPQRSSKACGATKPTLMAPAPSATVAAQRRNDILLCTAIAWAFV